MSIAQYLVDHGADVNQSTDVSNIICLHNNYLLTTAIQSDINFLIQLQYPISNFDVNIYSFMISNLKCWLLPNR